MKLFRILMLLLAAALVAVACDDEEETPEPVVETPAPSITSVTATDGVSSGSNITTNNDTEVTFSIAGSNLDGATYAWSTTVISGGVTAPAAGSSATYSITTAGTNASYVVTVIVTTAGGTATATATVVSTEEGALFQTTDADGSIVVRRATDGVPVEVRRQVEASLDGVGGGAETVTWSATVDREAEEVSGFNVPATSGVPQTFILRGFIFVNGGQTLTVEAGTVIQAQAGQGSSASALITAIGGTINVNGTSDAPVIMTYEGDDVSDNTQSNDFTPGLWGGLILCGDASTNLGTAKVVEGLPTNESRGNYGGDDDADNSGIVTYVSIRNSGTSIGPSSELQGLTLAAVGSGTTIDYVESIFSNDDGIEVFGGTVNINHFLAAFIDDDMFDLDQGWRGLGQYWFGYQFDDNGNRGAEWDGDDAAESPANVTVDGQPYSTGRVANMTVISNKVSGEGSEIIRMRNGAGYSIYNSIFSTGLNGFRFEVNNTNSDNPTPYEHFVDSRLEIVSNVWADVGNPAGTTDTSNIWRLNGEGSGSDVTSEQVADFRARMRDGGNVILTTANLSYPETGRASADASAVNPVPSATTDFPTPAAPDGFAEADFIGAFNPDVAFSSSWASWTFFAAVYGN